MSIPSTDITIDGDTAWLVVRNQDGWFWKTDHNRPCDTCNGHGHVRQRLHDAPGIHRPVTCPDCHGTGRHTFTLDVQEPCRCKADCGDIATITVHVVEVLPIGDKDTMGEGFLYGGRHLGPNWIIVGGGSDQPNITLPDSAAPGKHAVHLAIKEKDAP
jgi:hypothetical protein